MTIDTNRPETVVLHSGYRRDPATNAVAVPIYQTTSYQFDSTDHASKLFGLEELGNIYTRVMNPTCDILEQRVTALEGGAASLAVSSGQAASAIAIQNIAQSGDNIVSSTDLYGGTWNLFANTFKTQGIEVRFVEPPAIRARMASRASSTRPIPRPSAGRPTTRPAPTTPRPCRTPSCRSSRSARSRRSASRSACR